MSVRLAFTKDLHLFLQQEGFTYLQLKGIEKELTVFSTIYNADDYILVPWREGITLFEETDYWLEDINSSDVTEMLNSELEIHFWVQLPVALAAKFVTIIA